MTEHVTWFVDAESDPLDAIGLSELPIAPIDETHLVDAVSRSFAELFGDDGVPGQLSTAESLRAAALEEKYRSSRFNRERVDA